MPSVLWRCWLGGRKGIRPVKNWVVGCWRGYLSGASAQLMPLPLTVSCFSKIQIGIFLVPAHPGRPGQRAIKRGMYYKSYLCCGVWELDCYVYIARASISKTTADSWLEKLPPHRTLLSVHCIYSLCLHCVDSLEGYQCWMYHALLPQAVHVRSTFFYIQCTSVWWILHEHLQLWHIVYTYHLCWMCMCIVLVFWKLGMTKTAKNWPSGVYIIEQWLSELLYNVFILARDVFSALTLLVGRQEEYPACKNWVVGCWCVWSDCLHMVQLMPLPPQTPLSLASIKSRLVLPFWYRLTQVVQEKRPLNGCCSSS